jgi:mannose-6-phosphate isomerase-like protein (cupin superfamily)
MRVKPALPHVLHAADAHEFFTSEQCHITEWSNSGADEQVSIARARVEPGTCTRWHRLHDTVERYCILQGRGEVELQDMPTQTVVPGDVVIIPPGCAQRIRNTGDGDLLFLAICTPRFTPEAYEEL